MVSAFRITYIMWKAKMLEEKLQKLHGGIRMFEMTLIHIIPHEKKEFEKVKKDYISKISKEIRSVNSEIKKFNKFLKEHKKFWEFENIKEIDPSKIISILKGVEYRDESISILLKKDSSEYKDKKMREENFELKIDSILNSTFRSIRDIMLPFIKMVGKFDNKKLEKTKYERWIDEINDVFSVGYPELALFIAGRLLENIIIDYMKSLRKNKKINITYKRICKEMYAESRLNYLKGKWISEKDYYKIKSIKFDRNIVAHYISRKEFLEARKDSEANIKISINLIEKIYSKILNQRRASN